MANDIPYILSASDNLKLKVMEEKLQDKFIGSGNLVTINHQSLIHEGGGNLSLKTIKKIELKEKIGLEATYIIEYDNGDQPYEFKVSDGQAPIIMPNAESCTKLYQAYLAENTEERPGPSGHLMILTCLDPRTFSDGGRLRDTTTIKVNGQEYKADLQGVITIPNYYTRGEIDVKIEEVMAHADTLVENEHTSMLQKVNEEKVRAQGAETELQNYTNERVDQVADYAKTNLAAKIRGTRPIDQEVTIVLENAKGEIISSTSFPVESSHLIRSAVLNLENKIINFYSKHPESQELVVEYSCDLTNLINDYNIKLGNGAILGNYENKIGNQPYNLPYYFSVEYTADNAKVTAHTITLDGNGTQKTFDLDIPAATQEKAGLMSSQDKIKLDEISSQEAGKGAIKLLGNEAGSGKPYNLPYYFDIERSSDKITAKAHTISLDNNSTLGVYSLPIAGADNTNAGLMTSEDYKEVYTNIPTDISSAKSEAISTAASDATTKANTAESNAKNYTDAKISTEVQERNTAITNAIQALDVAAVTPTQSETIKSISEVDGKIVVEKQSIQITESQVSNLVNDLDSKVNKNADITGATKTKITYDSKGLVTAGEDLIASDIPNLDASKITSGTFTDERIASADTWNAKLNNSNPTGTGYLNLNGDYSEILNTAPGEKSVTLGNGNIASGEGAVAEGYKTTASGKYSHTEGYMTTASADYQHVFGSLNPENNAAIEIVGGGTDKINKANFIARYGGTQAAGQKAVELGLGVINQDTHRFIPITIGDSGNWSSLGSGLCIAENDNYPYLASKSALRLLSVDGDEFIAGDYFANGNKKVATLEYVDSKVVSVYRFKGAVDDYEDLPTEENESGDVWNVKNEVDDEQVGKYPPGTNFAWVKEGSRGYWDALGGSIDLSKKQDKLTAQDGINITDDAKISVKYDDNTIKLNSDGKLYAISGGTTVIANPTLVGTEANLDSIQIGDTKYNSSRIKPFPSAFVTDKTLKEFGQSIVGYSQFKMGSTWYGGISCSDLPGGMMQVECKVTAIRDTTITPYENIAIIEIFSSEVAPFYWTYNTNSWEKGTGLDDWKYVVEIDESKLNSITAAYNEELDVKVKKVNAAAGSTGWEFYVDKPNTVIANPTLAGTEADLTGLQVGTTKYKVPSGGGGEPSEYLLSAEVDTDNHLKINNKLGQQVVDCTVNYTLDNAKVKAVLTDAEKEALVSGITGTSVINTVYKTGEQDIQGSKTFTGNNYLYFAPNKNQYSHSKAQLAGLASKAKEGIAFIGAYATNAEGTDSTGTSVQLRIDTENQIRTFEPGTSNSVDLGSSTKFYKDAYIKGNLSDNTNSVSISQIAKKDDFSASATGTSTTEVNYIKLNGTEYKLPSGGSTYTAGTGINITNNTISTNDSQINYDNLKNKPETVTAATVASTGSYNDLTNKPTFKTINSEEITGTGNISCVPFDKLNGYYHSYIYNEGNYASLQISDGTGGKAWVGLLCNTDLKPIAYMQSDNVIIGSLNGDTNQYTIGTVSDNSQLAASVGVGVHAGKMNWTTSAIEYVAPTKDTSVITKKYLDDNYNYVESSVEISEGVLSGANSIRIDVAGAEITTDENGDIVLQSPGAIKLSDSSSNIVDLFPILSASSSESKGKYLHSNATDGKLEWADAGSAYTAGKGIDITNNTIKATGVEYTSSGTVQTNALKFVRLTAAEYAALTTKDANTFYIIIG